MYNRLLEANGRFKTLTTQVNELSSSTVELVVGIDTVDSLESVHKFTQIVVKFGSSADGRGFSMAAELRESRGYDGELFAAGVLMPDQLSLAFQCGFDAVIVDEAQWSSYGKDAWVKALNPDVNRSYLQSHLRDFESIWESRATLS